MMPLRRTGALTVVERDPVAICIACDIRNPFLIFEVPTDRPAQAAGERFLRFPAQLAFDLARINPVAPVMTRPVCHERNLLSIGLAVVARLTLVQEIAELMHDFKIRLLAGRTDIVDLAWPAPLQHAPDCGTMVRHVEPVTNILSVAIDRQRIPGESAVNH